MDAKSLLFPLFILVGLHGQPRIDGFTSDFAGDHILVSSLSSNTPMGSPPKLYEVDGESARLVITAPTCAGVIGIPSAYYQPKAVGGLVYTQRHQCSAGRYTPVFYRIRVQGNPWVPDGTLGWLTWSGPGDYAVLDGESLRWIRMSDGLQVDLRESTPPDRSRYVVNVSHSGQVLLMDLLLPASLTSPIQFVLWNKEGYRDLELGGGPRACELDPQDRYVACVTSTQHSFLFDLATREQRLLHVFDSSRDNENKPSRSLRLADNGDRVILWETRVTTDGERQAGHEDYVYDIRVFSTSDGAELFSRRAEGQGPSSFSGNGRYFFVTQRKQSIQRYDMEVGDSRVWLEALP